MNIVVDVATVVAAGFTVASFFLSLKMAVAARDHIRPSKLTKDSRAIVKKWFRKKRGR